MIKRRVVKFGGSNLKKKEDLQRVLKAIKCYQNPVIVVSAFYGVTDFLENSLKKLSKGDEIAGEVVDSLQNTALAVLKSNLNEGKRWERSWFFLSQRLKELFRLLTAVNYLGEIPQFTEDQVLSYGVNYKT